MHGLFGKKDSIVFSTKCKLHLDEADQKPLRHMMHALTIAAKLQLLVPVLIIHSVVPRCFTNTASNVMKDILNKQKDT